MQIIDNKAIFITTGKLIKIGMINRGDEWYHDIDDPESFVREIKKKKVKADIFTFRQNLPDTKPKFNYHLEWESTSA